ncbi:MAG: toprim domain-containing protein [Nitrosopumilus sp.]|nr:toprim domain-containing protein [Nitrosopumilus sp.]MDF2423073.1 toprim domain-containing protein [Nitrosopumilus sp.]MDF2424297.1 toprim domain-containing protein [Nitrosopumilus sp.]MDF2425347.1 toprim domain-containing protein [Nitrosopumilus sp.]MDF2427109.1 toprim domain-containing protein [Nitrosopumilus sp.]
MIVTEQEISELKDFIFELNSMTDSVVVVEGKRDSNALRRTGYRGEILEFHRFGGMVNFADSVAGYQRLIILFDRDRKGRTLTGRTIQLLQRRTKVDLTFKRKLRTITKGKIMFVEQLVSYESYLT